MDIYTFRTDINFSAENEEQNIYILYILYPAILTSFKLSILVNL